MRIYLFLSFFMVGGFTAEQAFAGSKFIKGKKHNGYSSSFVDEPDGNIDENTDAKIHDLPPLNAVTWEKIPTENSENPPSEVMVFELDTPVDIVDTFPMEIINHVVLRANAYERPRLREICRLWNAWIESDRTLHRGILGTVSMRDIPHGYRPMRRVKPWRNIWRSHQFFLNGMEYHLSQKQAGEFRFSLTNECVCHGHCIIHERDYKVGGGSVGEAVRWWGTSLKHSLFFIATRSNLFVFRIEMEAISGIQFLDPPRDASSLDFQVMNAPFRFLRRVEVDNSLDLGRVNDNILYLFSAIANNAALLDLSPFASVLTEVGS